MKHLLIIAGCVVFALSFNACTEESAQPTKPNAQNGDGILSGRCLLYTYQRDSSWHQDQLLPSNNPANSGGTLIELLGTQITAVTDSAGSWVLRGITAGTYSLRFTHAGFDTMTVNNVPHNGEDSVSLVWTGATPSGQTKEYRTVCLAEPPATVNVINAGATSYQTIYEDLGGRKDTSYDWEAQLTIGVDAPISTVQSMLSVGFLACIADHTPLQSNELPIDIYLGESWESSAKSFFSYLPNDNASAYPNGDKTKRYFEIKGKNGTNPKVYVNLGEYAEKRGIALAGKPQLYLHIVPVWQGFKREWHDGPGGYRGGPNGTPEIGWVVGAPQSFPIQWQ